MAQQRQIYVHEVLAGNWIILNERISDINLDLPKYIYDNRSKPTNLLPLGNPILLPDKSFLEQEYELREEQR